MGIGGDTGRVSSVLTDKTMPLTFDRDFDPRHGEAVEIVPGVRRVTARNAGPFTFHGTNTFLIGERALTMIDPGPADDAHVNALMRAIGTARVACILVTHTHRDHSPAARVLKERTGAPVLAAGPHIHARPPHAAEEARLDAAGDFDFAPDAALADGETIEGADHRLEVIATSGHTANHLAFALAGTGIVFTGDHVMGWSTTVVAPPEGSMRAYMASLERLLARPEMHYLPAHGGDVSDGRAHAEGLRAHRKAREAAILEGLHAGDRTVAALVRRIYREVDPRLAPAAALSTFAHLEDLAARGAVASDGPPLITSRYRPKVAIQDHGPSSPG